MTHQLNITPQNDLWAERIEGLGLSLPQSPMWPVVQKLYAELAQLGVDFQPPCFVASEWGCPDGLPLIGVPFYLVDPRFHALEEEHADDLEDEPRILAGLRHEAGHALNYAYKLYLDPEWHEVFGSYYREYKDDYYPEPWSPDFIRHLPGWYAQKHPDEDFAETFAVWLTPGFDWRGKYAGTPVLAKLEYIERAMARVGKLPPVVDPASCAPDADELAFTLGDFYEKRAQADAPPVDQLGTHIDDDLRELFAAEGIGTDAATLLWEKRRNIMKSVATFTGARMYVAKAIIVTLVARLRHMALRAGAGREIDAMIGITALVTTLAEKFLRTGRLI